MVKIEGNYPGEHLVREMDGYYSRDAVIIGAEQNLQPGAVLGKISPTTNKTAAISADDDNTGDAVGALHTTPFTAAAKLGRYKITCHVAASAGDDNAVFVVEDPDGNFVGQANQGDLFDGEIKFTIGDDTSSDTDVGDTHYVDITDAYATVVLDMDSANTGGATIATYSTGYSSAVKHGVYTMEVQSIPSAGAEIWTVKDPFGNELLPATTGVDYDGEVKFKISASGAALAVGDKATAAVNLSVADDYYVAFNPGATNGSEVAAAVLFAGVTTGEGEKKKATAHTRSCEVAKAKLSWGDSVTEQQKALAYEQLKKAGIIAR